MIEYEIFYGPHGSAKDIEGLAKALHRTDILLPESIGWTPMEISWNWI